MEFSPFFEEKWKFLPSFTFKGRAWVSSLIATIAGLGLMAFFLASHLGTSDYIQAENGFVRWVSSSGDETLFQSMQTALHKVPSLEHKYEPVIVQKLIALGKGATASEMAPRVLEAIHKEAPFHGSFAETSLLIEKGAYQIALQQAVGLKEKMSKNLDVEDLEQGEAAAGSVLYVHNLLRIACLHQELHNKPGELAAWEEVERFLFEKSASPLSRLILKGFEKQGISLSQYISARKKQIGVTPKELD